MNRNVFEFWSSGDAASVHSSVEGTQRRGWWPFGRSREGGRAGRQLREVGGESEELAMFRSPNTLDDEVERRRGAREESRWGRVCQRAAARLLVAAALLALVGVWVLVTWQKTIMQVAITCYVVSGTDTARSVNVLCRVRYCHSVFWQCAMLRVVLMQDSIWCQPLARQCPVLT